jgi:hypothetical protein
MTAMSRLTDRQAKTLQSSRGCRSDGTLLAVTLRMARHFRCAAPIDDLAELDFPRCVHAAVVYGVLG